MSPQSPITVTPPDCRGPERRRPESGSLTRDPVWVEDRDLLVRLARDEHEVRAAQRVRFEVFGLELDERLEGADALGRDVDPFDAQCDHLLLIDRRTDAIVGTYRLQTLERATSGIGFYCDQEFVLDDLPDEVRAGSLELGRACVLASHRNGAGLLGLWRGLHAYAGLHRKRYLFGCCSLSGTDAAVANAAARWIEAGGHRHPSLEVRARESHRPASTPVDPADVEAFRPPRLFGSYLRYSSQVCGGPALDREFGTTDFFVLCDLEALNPRLRRLLLEG